MAGVLEMIVDHSINNRRCYSSIVGFMERCQVVVDEISLYNARNTRGQLVPGVRYTNDYGARQICGFNIKRIYPVKDIT